MKADVERFGPTRRGGPIFRWLGEPLAIDLANTVMVVRDGDAVDLIAEPSGFRRWLEIEADRLGDVRRAVARVDEVRSLRDAVRALLTAAAEGEPVPGAALQRVSAASAAAPIVVVLTTGPDGALQAVERELSDDPVQAMLGRLARSAISLVTGGERERLRMCRAPSCGMFFIGARRWCCSACGNRARAARHYRRRRTRLGPAQTP